MKTDTPSIIDVLKVATWILYGGSIVYFSLLLIHTMAHLLFYDSFPTLKLITDLPDLRQKDLSDFIGITSILLFSASLHISLWKKVKSVLEKVNLQNPFSIKMVKRMEQIAFIMLGIYVVGYLGDSYAKQLSKTFDNIDIDLSKDMLYAFNAGIIYVFSQVMKRGLELQEEQNLTI